jgi:hypothetical protein
LPESGDSEVDDDGDDEVDDKERRRLHRLCEIEMRSLDGRAVCQCAPPPGRLKATGAEEDERMEERGASHREEKLSGAASRTRGEK